VNYVINAILTVVLVAAAAVLMIWGWRRRQRRQAGVPALPPVPAGLDPEIPGHRGKYVATTTAGDPYDRIAVRGLAFRGFATVGVHPTGLLIERDGEASLWIAASELIGVDRATWTIDRVVEEDGLHLVRWRNDGQEFDTYLRIDEPVELDAAWEAGGLPRATSGAAS